MENKEKIRALFQKWKKERTDENFENFYNASKTLVYKIAFTFLKNEEDSKDLVQEIFVKIYKLDDQKLPSYNETTWIYSVAKNLAINFIKAKRPQINLSEIYELQDDRNEIDKIIEKERFENLIYNLPIKEQEIISLRILGDFTFKEIANLLDMKVSTVQWYYYKSIRTLRLFLANMAMFAITLVLYLKSSLKDRASGKEENSQIATNETANTMQTNEILEENEESQKNELQDTATNETKTNSEENEERNSVENSLDTENNVINEITNTNEILNNVLENATEKETLSGETQTSNNFTFVETTNSYLFACTVFFVLTIVFLVLFIKSQKNNKRDKN